jgi:tRNA-specific 2-thiouridylase
MSGGVDSSVAAALLAESGHDVIGLSMQLYDQQGESAGFGSCCSLDDLYDAGQVARRLNIPHYIVNFEEEFRRTVVANFVGEYVAGRTPIPCAHCNSDLKFATLLERSVAYGAEVVATGHYARIDIDTDTGRRVLRRGLDQGKDQSYFLFSLTQEQLSRASFPVGTVSKDEVREIARRLGLPVAAKPDSQEICFVQPLYVLQLRPAEQTVVVGPRPELERTSLRASGVNWISGVTPEDTVRAAAQIRHRHTPAACTVRAMDGTRATVEFDAPVVAITPGQAVVFYDGDIVLGGGWID